MLFCCTWVARALFPIFALTVALIPLAGLAESRDPDIHFFSQSFGDLREEMLAASEGGKLGMLIMFDDVDCPWCYKMHTRILNQAKIQDYYRQHFRIIKVDVRGDQPLVDFAGKEMLEKDFAFKVHRVRATPAFIFFDLNGDKLFRYTRVARSVDEFLWLGEYIVNGHYKTKRYPKYKRERLAAVRNPS